MVNKFATIKERVVQIAEKQELSKKEFFASIGMTSASFRGAAKETPLNSRAIENIISKYPEVDLYWLLLGEAKPKEYKTSSLVREPAVAYGELCKRCDEKDEIIQLLKSQIKDLKSDKEDLKKLLGLIKKK